MLMKLQQWLFVTAIAVATLTIGCATTGTTVKTPRAAVVSVPDAMIYINGLS